MYVIQHLKSTTYGIVEHTKIIWHNRRDYATWFDTRQDAEDALERIGVCRDSVRIVRVYNRN